MSPFGDDPLTEAELSFRKACCADTPKARGVTPEYSRWAERVRKNWTARPAPATPTTRTTSTRRTK